MLNPDKCAAAVDLSTTLAELGMEAIGCLGTVVITVNCNDAC